MNNMNKTQIKIVSFDNLFLNANMYKQNNYSRKWVIIVHGIKRNGEYMESYTLNFYKRDFNVIAPDCRGHGKSEGKYAGMGWHDRLDVIKFIEKIIEMDRESEIILFGISMGGASVLSASGENLPQNVKCIISDCSFSDVYKIAKSKVKSVSPLFVFTVLPIANLASRIKNGYFLSDAKPINQVKKSKTPILFIHGDEDKLIPVAMAYELYEACASEKDILIIKGAAHAFSSISDPKNYWLKIDNFINKYL